MTTASTATPERPRVNSAAPFAPRPRPTHQTPYAQLVASVSPETRRDYVALLRGKAA